ncbi:unnamed protein product [Symbiodinium sp. CCMP2592]|nr:unnamed protein product [Symbiodinium sp. CCMP2592]
MADDGTSWAYLSCFEDWQSHRSKRKPALEAESCPPHVKRLCDAACQQHPELAQAFKIGRPVNEGASPSEPFPVRGIVQIKVGSKYAGHFSPGWSEKAFFMHEICHDAALDAYTLEVQKRLCFALWEDPVHANCVTLPNIRKVNKSASADYSWIEDVPVCSENKSHKKSLICLMTAASIGSSAPVQSRSGADLKQKLLQLHLFEPSSNDIQFRCLREVLGDAVSEKCLDFPVLRLPRMIAFLVVVGLWHEVVMLSRWTHPHFPSLTASLPQEWLTTVAHSPEDGLSTQLLTLDHVENTMGLMRRLGAQVLPSLLDDDARVGLEMDLESCLRALRAHGRTLDVSHAVYHTKHFRGGIPSDVFVQQLVASLDLKDKSMLKRHAERFCACLPKVFRPLLDAWMSGQVVSATSLVRGRLFLDVAMQLVHRQNLSDSGGVLKYAWGDASSKYGLEVYNSRYRWFKKSQCVELARAWRYLCNNPWGPEVDDEILRKRAECSQLLHDSIHLHTMMPQLLGSKRTTLPDKVSAHVHASLLECSSLQDLDTSFDNHISWTSDMGVEAGLPSFGIQGAEKTLPPWLQPARANVVEGEEFVEDGPVVNEDAAVTKPLMQHALQMPGICHCIHNATETLETAFHWFETFVDHYKVLDKFLSSKQRRERFVEVVMYGSPAYETAKQVFSKQVPAFYTKRWNAFTDCLRETLPMALFLRSHWDHVRYLEGLENAASVDDGWAPTDLNSILSNNYFFAYWRMQLKLRGQLSTFMSWAEGCSCHKVPRRRASDHEDDSEDPKSSISLQSLLNMEITSARQLPRRCPMMGCQAPFLASDHLETLSKRLAESSHHLVADCHERLSQEEWGTLLSEWKHGTSVIIENLKLRLEFYTCLPWVLLSGAHPVANVARQGLQKALRLWEQLPDDAKASQHLLVRGLFQDAGLSEQLVAFLASDDDIESFPQLEQFFFFFSFVQVAERLIEAAHKDLGQSRPKNFSMNLLSINMRLPELDRYLWQDPGNFAKLVDAFEQSRHLRSFTSNFPCYRNHPKMLSVAGKRKSAKFESFVREALYRDARLQFADVKEAAETHKAEVKKREAAHKPHKNKVRLSEAVVVGRAITDRIREVAHEQPGTMFSIHAGPDQGTRFFTPVLLNPSGLRRPVHAPCTLHEYAPTDMLVTVCENRGSVERPLVNAMSAGSTETLSMQQLLAACDDMHSFVKELRVWSRGGGLKYCLPLLGGGVSTLLQTLLDHGAVPGKGRALAVQDGAREGSLQMLQGSGYVDHSAAGWQLTQKALQSMEFFRELSHPTCFADPGEKPLSDMSTLELVFVLQSKSWTWSKLPAKKVDRDQLEFVPGKALVWRTVGVTVPASYMRCLLDADRLQTQHGISAIPHGLSTDVYEQIFLGVQPAEAIRAIQDQRRKRKREIQDPGRLQIDVEIGEVGGALGEIGEQSALAALAPVPNQQSAAEQGEGEGGLSDLDFAGGIGSPPDFSKADSEASEVDSQELIAELENAINAVDAKDANDGHDANDASVAEPPPRLPEGGADAMAVDPANMPQGEPLPLPRPAEGGADAVVDPANLHQILEVKAAAKYGFFSFSRKQARSAPPFGGYEAICRYHKRSNVTGCKRFVRLPNDTEEGRAAVITTLQHWCNSALKFSRQRDHVRMPLAPEDVQFAIFELIVFQFEFEQLFVMEAMCQCWKVSVVVFTIDAVVWLELKGVPEPTFGSHASQSVL